MCIAVNIVVDNLKPKKIHLFGHVTNQHKKYEVCQNIFPSKKVLEAHTSSVSS